MTFISFWKEKNRSIHIAMDMLALGEDGKPFCFIDKIKWFNNSKLAIAGTGSLGVLIYSWVFALNNKLLDSKDLSEQLMNNLKFILNKTEKLKNEIFTIYIFDAELEYVTKIEGRGDPNLIKITFTDLPTESVACKPHIGAGHLDINIKAALNLIETKYTSSKEILNEVYTYRGQLKEAAYYALLGQIGDLESSVPVGIGGALVEYVISNDNSYDSEVIYEFNEYEFDRKLYFKIWEVYQEAFLKTITEEESKVLNNSIASFSSYKKQLEY